MNWRFRLQQELLLLLKNRSILGALSLLLVLSGISVLLGLDYVAQERQQISQLIQLDAEERAYKRTLAVDYGGAAYDAFHAVWHPPSDFAFAAIGQRDLTPTMMRIRALAIEGQIYETDSFNPELGLTGRFDFAFVAAYLLPLIILFVFHDLVATERENGRLNLLRVTAQNARLLWLPRVLLRLLGILLAVLTPLWFGMLLEGTAIGTAMKSSLAVSLQVILWTALVLVIATRASIRSETVAAMGFGIWVLLTLAIPVIGKIAIEQTVPGIKGSEVSLVQREAVNDAWDLPIAQTMDAFYASHPEWSDSPPITGLWHWKWYYAFQQLGDESAAQLAAAYRNTMLTRDRLTANMAWISPAVAIQRQLEALAATNLKAGLVFEDQVRRHHEQIRRAYYPVLFRELPFTRERLARITIPDFMPAADPGDD